MNKLDRIRSSVNSLDEQLLELFAKRRALSLEAVKEKYAAQIPLYDPKREAELLQRLSDNAQQLSLSPHVIRTLYQVILKDSLSYQRHYVQNLSKQATPEQNITVAYVGHAGTMCNLAAAQYFHYHDKKRLDLCCTDMYQVVDTLQLNHADYGVIPVENSRFGVFNDVYELLQQQQLYIVGEILSPNEYCLLTHAHTDLTAIRTVYAHPLVYEYSREFMDRLGPVSIVYCRSNIEAIQQVRDHECQDVAAIGHYREGKPAGLTPVLTHTAQVQEGASRFWVVAKKPSPTPIDVESVRTTLVCSVAHQTSILADVLSVFKAHNIVIAQFGSKPMQADGWHDMLYLDVEAHQNSVDMQKALQELSGLTQTLKVLGCYAVSK